GDGQEGLDLEHSSYFLIGGPNPADRNLIAGHSLPDPKYGPAGKGVWLNNSSYNTVENNYIGTDRTGTKPAGNLVGLRISGTGTLTTAPGNYTLEVYADTSADAAGNYEEQIYLASAAVTVGASGSSAFSIPFDFNQLKTKVANAQKDAKLVADTVDFVNKDTS